jgi:hypothetical protein
VRVESPRAGLLRGAAPPHLSTPSAALPRRWELAASRRLHVALVGAAGLLALTSSGDVYLLAVLLGLVVADAISAGMCALALTALVVRYGTSSLAAVAGAQGVLGPAAFSGGPLFVAATWAAALSVALISRGGLPLVAFGLTAGAILAGPAPGEPLDLAVRIGGAILGLALAWGGARYLPRRLTRPLALAAAAVAVGLAAVGRFV